MQIGANTGLVLEGGGMRGVFTSGVLDAFMKHGLRFNYVVAVSAGACNGMSYMSWQISTFWPVTIIWDCATWLRKVVYSTKTCCTTSFPTSYCLSTMMLISAIEQHSKWLLPTA